MIEIKIMLTQDGQVQVSGPLHDKILCLGLLEMAKQTIHDYKGQPNVIPFKGPLPPNLKAN